MTNCVDFPELLSLVILFQSYKNSAATSQHVSALLKRKKDEKMLVNLSVDQNLAVDLLLFINQRLRQVYFISLCEDLSQFIGIQRTLRIHTSNVHSKCILQNAHFNCVPPRLLDLRFYSKINPSSLWTKAGLWPGRLYCYMERLDCPL